MRAKVALILLVLAALAGACREKPRTLDVAEPGEKFLVRSGTTAGSDWRLYFWPASESGGWFTPATPERGATYCFGLWAHSSKRSCDVHFIPRQALVIAHSIPVGKNEALFYGVVDGRASRLVFRFADGTTLEQPLFGGPESGPSFKFFVATPPKKGDLGNFDPLVYDAQGRELKPGN